MMRRGLSNSFGFIRGIGEKVQKQNTQTYLSEYFRDSRINADKIMKNAVPIDLTKLKLEHMPDTDKLNANVPQL